jgi:hypothetical protein
LELAPDRGQKKAAGSRRNGHPVRSGVLVGALHHQSYALAKRGGVEAAISRSPMTAASGLQSASHL